MECIDDDDDVDDDPSKCSVIWCHSAGILLALFSASILYGLRIYAHTFHHFHIYKTKKQIFIHFYGRHLKLGNKSCAKCSKTLQVVEVLTNFLTFLLWFFIQKKERVEFWKMAFLRPNQTLIKRKSELRCI